MINDYICRMKLDKLEKHLENTPLEELQREWEEIVGEWKNVGPSAEEFVKKLKA